MKLYLIEIIKGLKITLKHLFSKKVTIEYPETRYQVPRFYRGFPVLNKDERGQPKCVACKLCEVSCPSRAIYIEIDEYPDVAFRERCPKIFNIDYGRCINCRYCEEACPVDAIKLTPFFEYTDYDKEKLIFDKEKFLEIGR
jgi:NADH-quinone oxidoreductase subunit I